MKQVQGYLTADNEFFESKAQAEHHEAYNLLEAKLISLKLKGEPAKFINLLEVVNAEASQYLRTFNAVQAIYGERKAELSATDSPVDYSAREEEFEAILNESSDSSESLPDVGDSEQQEEVRDGNEEPSPRSRSRHARRVRGR